MLTYRGLVKLLIIVGLLLVFAVPPPVPAVGEGNQPAEDGKLPMPAGPIVGMPTYLQWLGVAAADRADSTALQQPMRILAQAYTSIGNTAHEEGHAQDDSLIVTEEGWVEWTVDLPEDGYYQLGFVYDSADSHMTDLVFGIRINGEQPYAEAGRIALKRRYADSVYPPERDEFDNDRRPKAIEVKRWQQAFVTNYEVDPLPLKWYLSKGSNTIRFVGGRDPIKLQALLLASPQGLAPPVVQAEERGEWLQQIEAEQFTGKSNASIQLQSHDSALVSPQPKGHIRYNSIGGDQFRRSGEWIEWEIDVPKDGIYHIGFKYLQAYSNNTYAYRTITIDGAAPYEELLQVGFPYNASWDWSGMTLAGADNQPLPFALTAGKHTIRMTVTAAPVAPIYEGLLRNLQTIGKLEQTIRKITGNFEKSYAAGGNTDVNRDWDLEKYIPGLNGQMTAIIEDLSAISHHLAEVTVGKSDIENAFRSAIRDLADLRDHPRTIPNRLHLFGTIQNNLGIWTQRMLDQPLLLDYLWVAEPGAKLPQVEANWLQRTRHTLSGFFRSFTNNYDFVRNRTDAIDVWVSRNRDYVNLIQQLVDEEFTPETGIAVNVNIVPDPQLLILGNLSGRQPDVALGVEGGMPIDFATRGALVDLNSFSDYEEVAQQFHPGALAVFHYDRHDYALPEVQGFNVLLYRADILAELGLEPPGTWDEVLKLLPTLQQNGYDFYIPPKDGLPFLYQQGASFYTEDGLSSALDREEALQGFEQWTEMFNLYQMPKEVPSFYSHFRLGDIPIGVVDFNTYLQVQFAAPELAGRWKIAPVPGTKQEDGTVVRWAGGALQAGVIFKQSTMQQEAWTFLKWWVSTGVQQRFGNDIEALYGPEYRWNTANTAAFQRLPWPAQDLPILSEQLRWYKEIPQVPGGYFTGRHLDIAWNKVVLEKQNPRVAIEQSVIDINREMERKQVEFGLRNREGDVLRTLDIPQITEPWQGGAP